MFVITKESDELITAKGKKEIRFFRNHKPEAEQKTYECVLTGKFKHADTGYDRCS